MDERTLNNVQARLEVMGVPHEVACAMWNALSYYSDFLGFDQTSEETEYEKELFSHVERWANE